MVAITQIKRVFVYEGRKLADPDPAMSAEEVRDEYVHTYPELATAVIDGPEEEGFTQTFTFRRAVGTKG